MSMNSVQVLLLHWYYNAHMQRNYSLQVVRKYMHFLYLCIVQNRTHFKSGILQYNFYINRQIYKYIFIGTYKLVNISSY